MARVVMEHNFQALKKKNYFLNCTFSFLSYIKRPIDNGASPPSLIWINVAFKWKYGEKTLLLLLLLCTVWSLTRTQSEIEKTLPFWFLFLSLSLSGFFIVQDAILVVPTIRLDIQVLLTVSDCREKNNKNNPKSRGIKNVATSSNSENRKKKRRVTNFPFSF